MLGEFQLNKMSIITHNFMDCQLVTAVTKSHILFKKLCQSFLFQCFPKEVYESSLPLEWPFPSAYRTLL